MRNRMNRMKVRTDSELIEEAHLYKQPILNLILAALLDSPFLGSDQNKPRLNNDDVLKLVANGLSEKVVVHVIELYEGDFDTTRAGLLSLRKHGVGDRVIETMQSKEFKATASDVSATVQESAA